MARKCFESYICGAGRAFICRSRIKSVGHRLRITPPCVGRARLRHAQAARFATTIERNRIGFGFFGLVRYFREIPCVAKGLAYDA